MAEPTQLMFKNKEVAEALVKAAGIHDGHWMLVATFGLGAGNVGKGPDDEDTAPAAIIPLLGLGIQRTEGPNALTVDAAAVNPVTLLQE